MSRAISQMTIFLIMFCLLVSFQNCIPMSSQILNNKKNNFSSNGSENVLGPIQFSNPLMDRLTIYSLFKNIFGSEADSLSAVKKIKFDRASLGGPCSIYEKYKSMALNYAIDPEADNCVNSDATSDLGAAIQPSGNIIQQALLTEACMQLTKNVTTFNFAMKQAFPNIEIQYPQPSLENISKIVSLFYLNKAALDNDLFQSIKTLFIDQTLKEGWKKAIQLTCESSHWQVI